MMNEQHSRFGIVFPILLGLCLFAGPLEGQKTSEVNSAGSPVEMKPPIVLGIETVASRDIRYTDSSDPLQTLDIYAPVNADNAPVIVLDGFAFDIPDRIKNGSEKSVGRSMLNYSSLACLKLRNDLSAISCS